VKRVTHWLALAGLALAAALFARNNAAQIGESVVAAGPGLVIAALLHALPMVVNAIAWRRLFAGPLRPDVRALAFAVWVRESVNGILPVARIGGEIVAYRMLRRNAVSRAEAAASLVADMALSVVSQSAFAFLGLGLLLAAGRTSTMTTQLLAAAAALLVLGGGFIVVQRAGTLAATTRVVARLFARPLRSTVRTSHRVDRAIRAVYARRRDVVACVAWQLVAWIAGAGEIWLALYFLGQPHDVYDAIAIEALIQAISSAAFIVPGALGIQEGGFVLVGAALGLDATTSLALAAARRLRDVVVFIPGLLAWQWSGARAARLTAAAASK